MNGHNLDDLHGDTIVSKITISCARSGVMKVEGSITDEVYALAMLDSARDVVKNYAKRSNGNSQAIIVPAYDTALVGTDAEKKLLEARHQLADVM
jgi:hypothetical protein